MAVGFFFRIFSGKFSRYESACAIKGLLCRNGSKVLIWFVFTKKVKSFIVEDRAFNF